MKKILVVFGTRPEAIKMAPLIIAFKEMGNVFNVKVCVTAQHREMLDQVLDFFEIDPDYDLNLMKPNQNLFQITADIITEMKPVLEDFQPDMVFVHGDTTTSMATALASFYAGIKVCHVEAGLRTQNKLSPFPEEMNRQITGRISDMHFAPTIKSAQNLFSENVNKESVHVVGNTVIDSLIWANKKLINYEDEEIKMLKSLIDPSKRIILITGHRRENFGSGFLNICSAIKEVSQRKDVQVIFPVHLNPQVQNPVYSMLEGLPNVKLIRPLAYPAFVWLMNSCYLILTDSGGVQEEAPSLGKPVLVMRDTTERPEAIDAGTCKLVGTDYATITDNIFRLLDQDKVYNDMSMAHNPYGDGLAAKRIVDILTT